MANRSVPLGGRGLSDAGHLVDGEHVDRAFGGCDIYFAKCGFPMWALKMTLRDHYSVAVRHRIDWNRLLRAQVAAEAQWHWAERDF